MRGPQRSKALRVIGTALRIERGLTLLDVDLSPPAVELDLVEPFRSGWRNLRQRRDHGLDEWNFTQHTADIVSGELSTSREGTSYGRRQDEARAAG